MNRPKRLTKEQKEAVSAAGLLPDKWMLVEQTEFYLKVIHKTLGKTRRIDRYAISKKGEKDEKGDRCSTKNKNG